MILIGIDPDVDKSGVSFYNKETKELFLHNMGFFKLFDFLSKLSNDNLVFGQKILVVIEAGWMNKSNWHKKAGASAALNAKIGSRTGANHEVGRKIVEMCEYLGLEHKAVRPTQKKINQEMFTKITGYKGRSNQENRDAVMLIWGM
jgi:hypothetical protein